MTTEELLRRQVADLEETITVLRAEVVALERERMDLRAENLRLKAENDRWHKAYGQQAALRQEPPQP